MDNLLKASKIIILICASIASILYAYSYFHKNVELADRDMIMKTEANKELEGCFNSMWSLYGNNDAKYNEKIMLCVAQFKYE